MIGNINRVIAVLILLIGQFFLYSNSFALTCNEVRQLIAVYLKAHYSFHNFDDELSKRTLNGFIKSWDPGKLYFFKADVEKLESKYNTRLDDMILANDCSAIKEIVDLFSKRFEERQKYISVLIDNEHDYTVEEYLEIETKNNQFPITVEDVNERWRKRVKFQLMQLITSVKDLKKSREKLHKRYELAIKRHNELNMDRVYAVFLNSFSTSLDPHSEYMSAEQLDEFRINTRLSLEGIGAVLRSEDGFTKIQSLVPGGAAAKTGLLKIDDMIMAVGQGDSTPVDVIDMDLKEVVKLIRGAAKTEVRLTILREEKGKTTQLVVPVMREKIQLNDRAAKSKSYKVTVEEQDRKPAQTYNIGVLELPSFYVDFEGMHNKVKGFRSSSDDLTKEINKLRKQNIDGIVLDLRNNGGGSLEESIRVAGLFFDKGTVVQIKGMDGKVYDQADKDGLVAYDGPLLVMINRQSASASEIFAGAIKDMERGLIVGDMHTFGKGTVQNLNDIGDQLGATKITISKFYRPSGSSTQLRGVSSDVVLPSIIDELEIGEEFYDHALPWDQIKKNKFPEFKRVSPYVKPLVVLSKERLTKDPAFKEVFEEIKKYKEENPEKERVSLKITVEDLPEELKKELFKNKKIPKPDPKTDATKDKLAEKDKINQMEDEEVKLENDIHLQETLRIAADYLQLLKNRKPGKIAIPYLKDAAVAQNNKAKKNEPVVKVDDGKATKADERGQTQTVK